jgi:quercetin dioxygenase-like cupin family protein
VTSEAASSNDLPARVVDSLAGEWREHPRFAGVMMQQLLTSADNSLASVNLVRLPAGREIGHHTHPTQVETAFILSGEGLLFLGTGEVHLSAGQVVAVPMNTVHGLRNPFDQDLEILAVFTPPMV